MNARILSLSLLAPFGFVSAAKAALVNIATNTLASPIRLVVNSAGSAIPLGSMVRIGTFSSPVVTPGSNFTEITSNFVPIGEDAADANDGINGPGAISTTDAGGSGWQFTINSVENTDSRFLAGKRLYIMVLAVPPSQMASANDMLIISDPGWTIPANGTRAMTTAQIDSQAEVMFGTWSSSQLRMSVIFLPEPSVSAMGLLAGLCALARRRRR